MSDFDKCLAGAEIRYGICTRCGADQAAPGCGGFRKEIHPQGLELLRLRREIEVLKDERLKDENLALLRQEAGRFRALAKELETALKDAHQYCHGCGGSGQVWVGIETEYRNYEHGRYEDCRLCAQWRAVLGEALKAFA